MAHGVDFCDWIYEKLHCAKMLLNDIRPTMVFSNRFLDTAVYGYRLRSFSVISGLSFSFCLFVSLSLFIFSIFSVFLALDIG